MIQKGHASIEMKAPIYICASGCIVGTKEGEGPLKSYFDIVVKDDRMGCNTWEEAESELQKEAVEIALKKAGLVPEDMRYLIAGDLLGQSIATSFGLMEFGIPLFGLYGACSTCGEALGLASIMIGSKVADRILCVTSSHFASAEKEFRYPLDYGNQRPPSSTWTVTGGAAFVLGNENKGQAKARITGMTTGKIVDYGIKDSMNMGACMAPAACSTIAKHFADFNRKPEEYDQIITGDLGSVGKDALLRLLEEEGYHIEERYMDCGMEIYDGNTQETNAGGSGCACSAVTLAGYLLNKLEAGDWKRILFVPTGALLSKTSFNEGQTIPAIAHGVVIERIGK